MISQDRLKNWARWVRGTYYIQGAARSLEGNYRSRNDDGAGSLTKRGRMPYPDAVDAWWIETCCRSLPLKHHLLLKLRYVLVYSDDEIARVIRTETKARMTSDDLAATQGMALALLEEALGEPPKVQSRRVQARVRLSLMRALTSASQVL